MADAVLIERFSERELRELVTEIIQHETEELRNEIVLLREELRRKRRVITVREATRYFDWSVTPATIIEYIWYQGLPAYKSGRTWFLYSADLEDFVVGRLGHSSTKKLGIKNVIDPRHDRQLKRHRDIEDVPVPFSKDQRVQRRRKPSPQPSPHQKQNALTN